MPAPASSHIYSSAHSPSATSAKPTPTIAATIPHRRTPDPGSYLLRTAEGHLEDETPVLATYTRSAVELSNAVPETVRYGETAHDINIRPVKGRLLTLGGLFYPLEPGAATLLMITDTGRRVGDQYSKPRPFSVTGRSTQLVWNFLQKAPTATAANAAAIAIIDADKDMPRSFIRLQSSGPNYDLHFRARLRNPHRRSAASISMAPSRSSCSRRGTSVFPPGTLGDQHSRAASYYVRVC